ncbi:hypothetical protein H634G_11079 [Metarhizium anisopliae BRIP 53293]|uniref:BED-type domain-containing protein n=1 Tax=Metarhizium anisopliae BRIP 53293 TaxID=1291518 RepID=A0A0D9NI19_METAN|nr:hypothetical protein H634G_11079 [Metarhizium anisopliae BRIP 53293]KJK85588.1 hypothetical protein H633G_10565 [Metarhizium anisopliae BRIP 53284]
MSVRMSLFEAASGASSLLPSDSISQAASSLSESDLSPSQHSVKRRKLRAVSTWDHFREAEGDEPHRKAGKVLHYCKRCRNPPWSTHISGNARYHLENAHHVVVREDSGPQSKRQLAIENAFARTTAMQVRQTEERATNVLRAAVNANAFREAQMLMAKHGGAQQTDEADGWGRLQISRSHYMVPSGTDRAIT